MIAQTAHGDLARSSRPELCLRGMFVVNSSLSVIQKLGHRYSHLSLEKRLRTLHWEAGGEPFSLVVIDLNLWVVSCPYSTY